MKLNSPKFRSNFKRVIFLTAGWLAAAVYIIIIQYSQSGRKFLDKNFAELKQGYEDYSYYSSNKSLKVKYADSAIFAAKKTNDNDLLSSAYLFKGSLYYFYQKNYQSALSEYLKAYQYSKNAKDDYFRYKVIYHMGLVKSYLGYYDEALVHFKECIAYFGEKYRNYMKRSHMFILFVYYRILLIRILLIYKQILTCKS